MAETIVSPGVLAIENDQSFITEQPVQAGAAIIGPTVKGKVGYSYLTSISAYNYFNRGGTSLLVTRVVSGSTTTDWTPATSSLIPTSTAATSASVSIDLNFISASVATIGSSSFNINGITLYFTGSNTTNTTNTIYINTGSFSAQPLLVNDYVVSSSAVLALSSSVSPYNSYLQFISSSAASPNLVLTSTNPNGLAGNSYYFISGSTTTYFSGGTNTESFILETLSEGEIMNSVGPTGSNGTLLSGSANNLRWQITSQDINAGTFTLIIRQGNDNTTSPSTYN